jgi:hypothetical protein
MWWLLDWGKHLVYPFAALARTNTAQYQTAIRRAHQSLAIDTDVYWMENSLYGIALGIGSSNAVKIQTVMLVWIASSIFFFNGEEQAVT